MTIAPHRPADHEVPVRRHRLVTAEPRTPAHRTPEPVAPVVPVPAPRGPASVPNEATGDTFRILFVCTGNVCRSPGAELLTRHLLVGRLGGRAASRVQVSSAGVRAVVGAPVHPGSAAELAPWGLGEQAERFAARQLEEPVVDGVDLVLGATPRHRGSVLERFPQLLGATFSLREFARLAELVDPGTLPADLVERSRALVGAARQLRGTVAAPDDDRIPDPIGGTPEDFRRATELTFHAVRTLMDVLAPRTVPVR